MIYLDHNGSTPLLPEVKKELSRAWDLFGNPSGESLASLKAAHEVDRSREQIADILRVNFQDIIFTSGSTEAISISIYGLILGSPPTKKEILVSKIEHKAVLATCYAAAHIANKVVIEIPVDTNGQIDLNFIEENINESTALICCMSANNETGVIQNLSGISHLAAEFETPLFCDSTQSFGKDPAVKDWDLDSILTVISGHKIYGPKGSGIAIIPRKFQKRMFKLLSGGGQERELRGGTLNVGAILGVTKALEIAMSNVEDFDKEMLAMRDEFLDSLIESSSVEVINNVNSVVPKLSNTVSLRFNGLLAEELIVNFKEVIASRASACTSGREEPSHVLLAMGLTPKAAESTIRFSLGRAFIWEDIPRAVQDVSDAIDRVRLLGR